MLSFSGQTLETVSLFRNQDVLQSNLDALKGLIMDLGAGAADPTQTREGRKHKWHGHLWHGVPADKVLGFLSAYRTHPDAHKVNSTLLAEFIRSMCDEGELTQWDVALIGASDGAGKTVEICPGVALKALIRTPNAHCPESYSIGRLLSPRDEAIAVNEAVWSEALRLTKEAWKKDPARFGKTAEPEAPSGPWLRTVRGLGADGIAPRPDVGLLLLYLIDPASAMPADTPAIAAFGISFPGSHSGKKVEYKVNNVLWQQEYGGSD